MNRGFRLCVATYFIVVPLIGLIERRLPAGWIHDLLQYSLQRWPEKKLDIPSAPRSVTPYARVLDIMTGSVSTAPLSYIPPCKSHSKNWPCVQWYEKCERLCITLAQAVYSSDHPEFEFHFTNPLMNGSTRIFWPCFPVHTSGMLTMIVLFKTFWRLNARTICRVRLTALISLLKNALLMEVPALKYFATQASPLRLPSV